MGMITSCVVCKSTKHGQEDFSSGTNPESALSHVFIFVSLSSTFCADYLGTGGYNMPSQVFTPHHDMTLGALSCRRNEKDMMVVQHTSYSLPSPPWIVPWAGGSLGPALHFRFVPHTRAMFFKGSKKSRCAEPGNSSS